MGDRWLEVRYEELVAIFLRWREGFSTSSASTSTSGCSFHGARTHREVAVLCRGGKPCTGPLSAWRYEKHSAVPAS
jgi:hypothetical protein